MDGVFEQTAAILAVCTLCAGLAVFLRLPLIVGLLLAGVVVGPQGAGFISGSAEIDLLGEIGIALLLFVVGLKLDARLVKRLGASVLAIGTIQVAITTAIGTAIAMAAGLSAVPAAYVGVAMAFSSTVIVVKVLSDTRELEQLHGRIALGILIVQDIVVVVLMIALSTVDPTENGSLAAQVAMMALRGAIFLGAVVVAARYLLPRVVELLARQAELLVLASVTWAVAVAAVAHLLDFSAEVGAFVAGVALASSGYREAIAGRLTALRDFLLVFFFISLGTNLEFDPGGDLLLIAALCAFVLLGKSLLIALITTLAGFRVRVGTRAGLTMSQISEFSLILVSLGVGLGHIEGRIAGIVTAVALITITVSAVVTARADRLLPVLGRPLRRFERARPRDASGAPSGSPPTVIVLGLGRLGTRLVTELQAQGEEVLAVEYDPRVVQSPPVDAPVRFGDAHDPELPAQLPLAKARWIISTLRDPGSHLGLLAALQHHGFEGQIAVTVDHLDDEVALDSAGIDLVVRPLHEAAVPFVHRILQHEADLAGQPKAATPDDDPPLPEDGAVSG